MALTASQLKSFYGKERATVLEKADRDNLTIRLSKKGKVSFYLRFQFNGKQQRLCVGNYRYMQADMFNLYPAIGAVNALRVNYNFNMLPAVKSDFGSCVMKIDNRKAEPPEAARGRIARTYLYMDGAYKRYSMSKSQRQLMNAWDKIYPVDAWEWRQS